MLTALLPKVRWYGVIAAKSATANFSYGGRTVGLKFPHDTDNASALSAGQPDSAIVLDSAAQKRNATEKGSEGWQTRPLKGLEV